jgi:hypothetical protein
MWDALDRTNISLRQLGSLAELLSVLPLLGDHGIAPRALEPIVDALSTIHSDLAGLNSAAMKILRPSRSGPASGNRGEFAETIHKVAARWTAARDAHPDATLIQLCAAEKAASAAVSNCPPDMDCQDHPAYRAWRAVEKALDQTVPQTIEGLAAKAQAALRRGTAPTGKRNTDDGAGFAWAIVEDVIRMQGGVA